MKLVVSPGVGQVELNYTWLPTWIGMNTALLQQMEAELAPMFQGRPLNDETLNEAHEAILSYLEKKYPSIVGLRDYLEGIKFVELR